MDLIRLAIIVGHSFEKKGAYSKYLKMYEYDYNKELAGRIKGFCVGHNILCEVFFRDEGGIRKAYNSALDIKPTCILELHFNAFNGKARGSEVLFSDNFDDAGLRELALAHTLSLRISESLKIPNRGVKERATKGERGFFNLSRTTHVPSVLIEPGFGDNIDDAKALKNQDNLAKAIVMSVLGWYLKVL